MDEVFNENVKNSQAFCDLAQEVSDLTKGQREIKTLIKDDHEQNKKDFEHGSLKFKQLFDKVAEMEHNIKNGFIEMVKGFNDYKTELKDERINKLTKIIEDKNSDEKEAKKRKVLFIQTVIVVALTALFTAVIDISGY